MCHTDGNVNVFAVILKSGWLVTAQKNQYKDPIIIML